MGFQRLRSRRISDARTSHCCSGTARRHGVARSKDHGPRGPRRLSEDSPTRPSNGLGRGLHQGRQERLLQASRRWRQGRKRRRRLRSVAALFRWQHQLVYLVTEDGTPTGKSRGFGYVEFATYGAARRAIERLHDTYLGDRMLLVREYCDTAPGYGSGKAKGKGKGKKGRQWTREG